MGTKERILTIRIMEKLAQYPACARKLGMELRIEAAATPKDDGAVQWRKEP